MLWECNYQVHFIVLGKVSRWGLDMRNLKISWTH
jgi:hypothetical protein